MEKVWTMKQVYTVMGLTRQAVHQKLKRQDHRDAIIEETLIHIRDWREQHPGMSAREMHYSMKNSKIELRVGINKFERILSEHGFNALRPRSKKPITSDGKGKRFENLTYGLKINDINQLIVTDITYYDLPNERTYIFIIKDVYSQRMLSIVPAKSLHARHAIKALKEVINLRGEGLKGCIHHSDNGSQFDSNDYQDLLDKNGLIISRAKSCQENGSAEHINHVAKNMYLEGWNIETFEQLKKACQRLKDNHNCQRAIEQLNRVSPVDFEQSLKSITLDQRLVKIMFDFNSLR